MTDSRYALLANRRVDGVWQEPQVLFQVTVSILEPSAVRLSNGNVLVAFHINSSPGMPYYGIWDRTTGTWSEFTQLPLVANATGGRGTRVYLAATSYGAVLLGMYGGSGIDGGTYPRSLMGVLYRFDNITGWSEPQVLAEETGDQLSNTQFRLAALPDDSLLITFLPTSSSNSLSLPYGVYATVINPDGSAEAPLKLSSQVSTGYGMDVAYTERRDGFAAVAFLDNEYLYTAIFDMVTRAWTTTPIAPDQTHWNSTPMVHIDRNDNVVVVMQLNQFDTAGYVSNGRPSSSADWPTQPVLLVDGPALVSAGDRLRSNSVGGAVVFAHHASVNNDDKRVVLLYGYDSVNGFTDVEQIAEHTTEAINYFNVRSVGLSSQGVPSVITFYQGGGSGEYTTNHVYLSAANGNEPFVEVLRPYREPISRCELIPDIAVSPAEILLPLSGRAQVEVAIRNLCADSQFFAADLLVSLSDGLRMIEVPGGWVNLGQRAAWQNLSLQPGETRRFILTVEADAALPMAPVHITELYKGGRVVSRIDGIFIVPAAPTEVAPTAAPTEVAPVPAETPVPAPLPSALPNTAGQSPRADGVQWLLPAVLVALAAAGLLRLRRS